MLKQKVPNGGWNDIDRGETEAVNTLAFKVNGKLYDFTITNLLRR